MDSETPTDKRVDAPLAAILTLLASERTETRRDGVARAGEILRAGAAPSIVEALATRFVTLAADPKWEVRFAVAHALQYLDHESFERIASKLIDDPHADVKNATERSLIRRRRSVRLEEKRAEDVELVLGKAHRLRAKYGHDLAEQALGVGKAYFQAAAAEAAHEILGLMTSLTRSLGSLDKEISKEVAKRNGTHESAGTWREHMENAVRRCRRVTRLAQDLRTYADRSPPEFTRESVLDMVNEAVRDVRDRFGPEGPAPSVDVEVNVVPKNIQMDAPRPKLLQALTNVIRNAFEAIEKRGVVSISARKSGANELDISIKDSGIGIAPEDQTQVFLPFRSTKKKKKAWVESTGLGLSIAQRVIVEDCRGRIDLESRLGQGTTVRIVLPLLREPAEEDESDVS